MTRCHLMEQGHVIKKEVMSWMGTASDEETVKQGYVGLQTQWRDSRASHRPENRIWQSINLAEQSAAKCKYLNL
jgi:hypothetical protein